MVSIDNPADLWNMEPGSLDAAKNIYNYYKPYLKIIQDCGCAEKALGCWSKEPTKTLNGRTYTYAHENGIGKDYCAVRLADGTN